MDDLSSLIARVEGLDGPDREVDAMLQCVVEVWDYRKRIITRLPVTGETASYAFRTSDGDKSLSLALRYTASIDAAITLTPEGEDIAFAIIAGRAYAGLGISRHGGDAEANTLPVAIVLTCLRARLNTEPNHRRGDVG